MPAVQSARESARRAQCANNLRQMILATQNFASQHGGFPSYGWSGVRPKYYSDIAGSTSPQCALLPYLEQRAVFDGINFDLDPVGSLPNGEQRANGTVAAHRIDTFLCGSDPGTQDVIVAPELLGVVAPMSYRANTGLARLRDIGSNVLASIEDGAFTVTWLPILPLASFTDGLSQTLAFSEKPVGSGPSAEFQSFRDYHLGLVAKTPEEWLKVCGEAPHFTPQLARTDAGASWIYSEAAYYLFSTIQSPNGPVPDCGGAIRQGLLTARGYHPGGVNAALCDGSVRFFRTETATPVWRALGTRNARD
jgi:prepilin-type processing-associated H-X9-DG protein